MNNILSVTKRKLNEKALPWVLKNKFGTQGINSAAARNIAVFPNLNLAFNRLKKNGNSTTVSLLSAMEDGAFKAPRVAKRQSEFARNANLHQLLNADKLFYFVIVRNPYGRTLSAFLNKFSKPAYIERYGSYPLDPDGFLQFLIWLEKSGLEEDLHWDLQKKSIIGPLENFDAVLRFEDFPNCLEKLLIGRGLNLPSTRDMILTSVHADTRTGASRKLAEFYSEDSIRLLKSLYHDDFAFLGYDDSL